MNFYNIKFENSLGNIKKKSLTERKNRLNLKKFFKKSRISIQNLNQTLMKMFNNMTLAYKEFKVIYDCIAETI